jgi:CHAD domain-containing protein
MLNRLEIAVENPRTTGKGSLKRVVRREHRRVRRLLRSAHGDPPNPQLHEIRKAVKRAHYAAELACDAGVPGARRYIKHAKKVQDVLGEHQDAVVAEAVLREVEPDLRRPIARMAAASLRERQRHRRETSRSAFPKRWRKLNAAAKSSPKTSNAARVIAFTIFRTTAEPIPFARLGPLRECCRTPL